MVQMVRLHQALHIKFLKVGLFDLHYTYCSESNLEIMIEKVHRYYLNYYLFCGTQIT